MSNTSNNKNSAPVKNPTRVVTGECILSYANLWEPKSINGGDAKYSVSLIIPKSDEETLAKIEKAIQIAYEDGKSKLKGNGKSVPPLNAIKNPLRDGDAERPDDEAYADSYFINANANSDYPPSLVDKKVEPITTHSEIYSGVYAKASINFYAFNANGNKGIAAGLNGIQKIRDGQPLGNVNNPKDDFGQLESDDADSEDDFLS
ncbi:hypothetical protein FACS1894105_04200 [Clostridia bacterium]|nr:hypothetical protein FACS1894105_04200 [Clostridia bacterium]